MTAAYVDPPPRLAVAPLQVWAQMRERLVNPEPENWLLPYRTKGGLEWFHPHPLLLGRLSPETPQTIHHWEYAPGQWAQWLSGAWLIVIGAVPFLNRDRMRGGDLIGGTIVIALPRQALLADQAQDLFHYAFTHRELSAYGAYELQVLEQVLRSARTMENPRQVMSEIGARIRRKIGWQGEVPPEMEERFLRDFYTAERAFLERERLFGKSKADKHDRAAGPS